MSILLSAARVLRCFTDEQAGLTMTDLVHRLGMPKSNASRLLHAMRNAGLLETIGDTKRYRPGLMLLDVGRAYRRSSTLIARADALAAALSSTSGHTSYVSKRSGREVTAILDHAGTNALRVDSSIGKRLPAFASATGRSLLARQTDADVIALYGGKLPPVLSPRTPRTMTNLLERLALIRKTGFALSEDEAYKGVTAIATATGDGEDEASVCIVFPSATTTKTEQRRIIEAMCAGTKEIARVIGDPHALERQPHAKSNPA